MTRKELTAAAKANAAITKAERAARKAELAALPREERNAAKRADKAAARAAKREHKVQLKELPRAQRRQAKRLAKKERKILTRPRRIVLWTVALIAVLGIGVALTPYVNDIRGLLAISVDSNTPEGIAARESAMVVSEQISDEGVVLLKNEGGALPLDEDSVNVFGFASMNLRFGGGGSGTADQSLAVNLYDALESKGVSHNTALYDALVGQGAEPAGGSSTGLIQVISSMLGSSAPEDPDPQYLTDELMHDAREFSPVALLVFGNDGVEAQDFSAEQLRLTTNQRALLDRVAENFDEIVVVINSGNSMELGFLEEYPEITAALNIGTPGPRSAVSLAKILTGEVNPSGRLTDTFAYDVESAPSTQNFGSFQYENVNRAFQNYSEGIYVGYRYYETRYLDDEAGYSAAVQFPFGYGLSYTDFTWEFEPAPVTGERVAVQVTVTNNGNRAGKDVVQIYGAAPYLPGGVEKSAIELVGFAKTELLEPGESQTLNVAVDLRDLASWDLDSGTWVLDPGTYSIRVGTNVHETEEYAQFDVAERITYDTDEVTGTALENRFTDAAGDLTYLSRDDWDGTFPDASSTDYLAPQEVVDAIGASPVPTVDDADSPILGADNGIVLADLNGLPYDDPQWDAFLDQFTLTELRDLFSRGGYQTVEIERLGIPSATLLDGPAGISFFFGDVTAAAYPTAVVIAQTWNQELANEMGQAVGAEARAYGVSGWYAPGMNLHRTPMGGRNFEYYSEDPVLSGAMGAAIVSGAESQGVVTFMKHFVLNDQETHARTGINIWANEQAMRELYLLPFEMTVKDGGATGAMSSFVHVGTTWSGGNEALLQDVLRNEWGFTGVVSTDAVIGGFMDIRAAALNGNDLMLDPLPTRGESRLGSALDEAPHALTAALKDRAHNVCYALLQTALFD